MQPDREKPRARSHEMKFLRADEVRREVPTLDSTSANLLGQRSHFLSPLSQSQKLEAAGREQCLCSSERLKVKVNTQLETCMRRSSDCRVGATPRLLAPTQQVAGRIPQQQLNQCCAEVPLITIHTDK